ncbi:MAG: 8-amino-7-oxononanoate synthase [Desulfofustis sp.]|nr:8-amino-7-oxononanoate synthase [Desulfofustis sp.]
MNQELARHLEQLAAQGMLRTLSPYRRDGTTLVRDSDRDLLNLSSNDYLGLAGDARLLAEFYAELAGDGEALLEKYGLGVASSRLLTGDTAVAHRLEAELSRLYGRSGRSALLFNSGYHANIGIIPALLSKGDLVLSDKFNHASLHDGLRIGRADCKRFNHGDYAQLRRLLEQERGRYRQVAIVSESVFSMDGDCADLAELVRLKKEFACLLYLDEAHAVGLYGEHGLGLAERDGVVDDIDLLVGTFGKACGSVGAFLICADEVRDYLINTSRSLIFTTALPPVVLSWNLFVFQKIPAMAAQRKHLQQLSGQLREELRQRHLPTAGTTNIVPVIVGSAERTVAGAAHLREQGFLVLPVRPPTVPAGTSRFRLSLTAALQWQDIEPLPDLIHGWLTDGSRA